MQFFSTRDQSRRGAASPGIAQGLAGEGGPFVARGVPPGDGGGPWGPG